jgi:pimeloyl-ACP methyl ester carboxylesterase
MGIIVAAAVLAGLLVPSGALAGDQGGHALGPVRHVRVGDINIGYRTAGSGPPLVLIMGYRGTMATWDPPFIAALARRYRVIAFDSRGVATTSNPPGARITIARMADDTAGLIRKLRLGRANVLGWSMGSFIAQELALRHPDRVNRVVLAATTPGGSAWVPLSPEVQDILINPDAGIPTLLSVIFPPNRIAAATAWIDRITAAAGSALGALIISPQTAAAQGLAITEWRGTVNRLPRLRKPVLVAYADKDLVIAPSSSRRTAALLPCSRTVRYRDAGHGFPAQGPLNLGFARTVRNFLAARIRNAC